MTDSFTSAKINALIDQLDEVRRDEVRAEYSFEIEATEQRATELQACQIARYSLEMALKDLGMPIESDTVH